MAHELTAVDFEEKVIKSDKPVLVDFFAPWCGPCQALAPTIDEISKELDGKAAVYKVNVDDQGELANKYNVMSIPTIIIFKDGKPVNQMVGAQSRDKLIKALES